MQKDFSFLNLFLFVLCTYALGSCVNEEEPKNIGVEGGDRLPSFSVTLNDGQTVSNASLKGSIAVIEFFNTGCSDCRESFPVFQALWEEYSDNPEVKVFAIAREETKEEIEAYWTEHSLTIPFSPQPDRQIYNLFATVGIPRIYIANRDGIIRFVFTDADAPSVATLSSSINSLIP